MTVQFGSTLSAASALQQNEDFFANCSAYRKHLKKVSCMTAVCCILCLLTVLACGCTIYQIQTFRNDLISLARKDVNSPDDIIPYAEAFAQDDGEIPMYGEDHKADPLHRQKRTKKNPKTQKEPKSANKSSNKNRKTNQLQALAASHYTSEVDENFIIEQFVETKSGHRASKKEMTQWDGTLYRNRTFSTTKPQITLKFFKEAPWMKNLSSNGIFDQLINGSFVARYTGLYHLYAHLTFYNAINLGVAISHEGGGITTNVLACNQNTIKPLPEAGKSVNYQACNINGVLFMEKGHIIKVTISCPNEILDMQRATTYFGGQLLINASAVIT